MENAAVSGSQASLYSGSFLIQFSITYWDGNTHRVIVGLPTSITNQEHLHSYAQGNLCWRFLCCTPPTSTHTTNEGCVKLTDKAYQDKSHWREYIWAVKETTDFYMYIRQWRLFKVKEVICKSVKLEHRALEKLWIKALVSHSELVPGP